MTLLPVTRRDTGEQMEDDLNVEAAATEVELVEEEEETLVNKKNASSIVWQHFGFNKDDIDQKIVKCKLCKKTVASSQGNTTNLFHHLQHNHVIRLFQRLFFWHLGWLSSIYRYRG